MLLDDMLDYFSAGGIGTPGATLFAGFRPERPDFCTTLYETGGMAPYRAMRSAAGDPVAERPSVQVVVRATSRDYQTARNLIHSAWKLVEGAGDVTINGTKYLWMAPRQSPFAMGLDEQQRPLQAFNFDVVKKLTDASVAVPLSSQYFYFGGDPLAYTTGNAYPVGATLDKIAPGTTPIYVDPTVLNGTFVMEFVAHVGNGTATPTCCLVNLDDGAPNTALTGSEASGTAGNQTGTRFRSGSITFPAGGTAKNFAVKVKTDEAAGTVTLLGASLIRTSY